MTEVAPLELDVAELILGAKLGRTRKDAQIDTCTVFAAALYDVLSGAGVACEVWDAAFFVEPFTMPSCVHAVVSVRGSFFDSMGIFGHEIVRSRSKIHPKVKTRLKMKRDVRCFDESDYSEMHAFYVKELTKSLKRMVQGVASGR